MSNPEHLLVSERVYGSTLETLLTAKSVLIYCGAGVSYSLTGLTWNDLILEVLSRIKSEFSLHSDNRCQQLEKLISERYYDPPGNATTLAAYLDELANEDSITLNPYETLSRAIGRSIYRKLPPKSERRSGWDPPEFSTESTLPQYIKTTVGHLVGRGVKVRVVTTNYDTHLERSLRFQFDVMNLDLPAKRKKYSLNVLGNEDTALTHSKLHPTNKTVPFIYLHGRVPGNNEKSEIDCEILPNQLVFSQGDYFRHKENTAAIMSSVSEKVDCVLILGSSLNDPPLVDWIQSNKRKKKDRSRVIVVQPAEMDSYSKDCYTDVERRELIDVTWLRYRALGVDHFIPGRCFADLPLLLRDAAIQMEDKEDRSLGVPITHNELKEWSSSASSKLETSSTVHNIFNDLLNNSKIVEPIISALLKSELDDSEKSRFQVAVRLEYWLRGIAPHSGDPEYLVKIADSSGVMLDVPSRRSESFVRRFPSRSSALRSVQLDAPELITLDTLGMRNFASRWQAFYAVPIRGTIGDSGLSYQVTLGSIVASLRLAEAQHNFSSRVDRDHFAEVATHLARKIRSGELTKSQNFTLRKINKIMRSAAMQSMGHIVGRTAAVS